MKKFVWVVMIVIFSVSFALNASAAKPFKIAAIFQTAIEEPWDGVIHQACLKAKKEMGNIEYEFTEKIAAADFEKVLREYAERGFDLIVETPSWQAKSRPAELLKTIPRQPLPSGRSLVRSHPISLFSITGFTNPPIYVV